MSSLFEIERNWAGLCSQEMLRDPVVCDDGISYERHAIQEWLQTRSTSFVTGATLTTKFLTPNRALLTRLQDLGLIAD